MTYARSLSQFRPVLWFALLALLVVGLERSVTRLPLFTLRPLLPLAVVGNVLVGIPLLFYFMVVRRYRLPVAPVPRTELLALEILRGDLVPAPGTLNLAKPVFAAPNLLLTFAAPVTVTGPYGICRQARRVALYLDQPQAFAVAAGSHSDFSMR